MEGRAVYADEKLIGVMDYPPDARLCTAAPAMLAVLKSFVRAWSSGELSDPIKVQNIAFAADTALKKAVPDPYSPAP